MRRTDIAGATAFSRKRAPRRSSSAGSSDESYRQSATEARARGWPVAEIRGAHHLAIATEPVAVSEALLDLERGLDHSSETRRNS